MSLCYLLTDMLVMLEISFSILETFLFLQNILIRRLVRLRRITNEQEQVIYFLINKL
jgi:hypothetical protein